MAIEPRCFGLRVSTALLPNSYLFACSLKFNYGSVTLKNNVLLVRPGIRFLLYCLLVVQGWKCLCGALRVLTLLSHGDLSWCEVTLAEEYALPLVALVAVQSQSNWLDVNAQDPPAGCDYFDLFCLSLGLLMNWATMCDKVSGLCIHHCKLFPR